MSRAQATVLSSRTRRSGLSLFDSVKCLIDGFRFMCVRLMKPRQTSSNENG